MSNKLLLCGSNGFIGTFLFDELIDEYSIYGLDYGPPRNGDKNYSIDLTNEENVNTIASKLPQCDSIIFLVGLAHKKGKGEEIDEFRRINKQTLVNLLIALDKENKVPNKIIFASTISVYGEQINTDIYNEDSDKNPISPYAVTKLEAEQYLLENYPTQSWILRFAPVYAPNFGLNIDRRTKAAGLFYKVGKGDQKLSLCNLENIGTAVQGILEDKVPTGIYNISDEIDYSYNDLLKFMNAKWIIPIPRIFVKALYYLGTMMNNIFLKENATKLISDNVFPSSKIRQYISLSENLNH